MYIALAVLCLLPLTVFGKEKAKVKVYIFEAGGCPYCEAERKYLEGLDSYNKKFEIVTKELYVDHVDWAKGADYDLGVKVANGFKKHGFTEASYQGTPFVVISDLYAAATYNTDLESIIEEAYEKGDKDIVQCFADGKTNCLDHLDKTSGVGGIESIVITLICTVAIIVVYLVKSTTDRKIILEAINENK